MSHENVIDITTGRTLDPNEGQWSYGEAFGFPSTENVIFSAEPMPKRMIQVTAVVPAECASIMTKQWLDMMQAAGMVKDKSKRIRRRAAK